MKKKKKREKWLKFRHRVVRNILSFTLGIYSKHKYGIKVEKFRDQEKRPYLILMNHQTAHDQFFVILSSLRGYLLYGAAFIADKIPRCPDSDKEANYRR